SPSRARGRGRTDPSKRKFSLLIHRHFEAQPRCARAPSGSGDSASRDSWTCSLEGPSPLSAPPRTRLWDRTGYHVVDSKVEGAVRRYSGSILRRPQRVEHSKGIGARRRGFGQVFDLGAELCEGPADAASNGAFGHVEDSANF